MPLFASVVSGQTPLTLSTSAVDFGSVQTGQSVTQVVTVTNVSTNAYYVRAQLSSDGNTEFTEANNCSYLDYEQHQTFLTADSSCQITIVFTPVTVLPLTPHVSVTAAASAYNYSPVEQTLTIGLSGMGLPSATLASSSFTFNFGSRTLFNPLVFYNDLVLNPGVKSNFGPTFSFVIGNPTSAAVSIPPLDQSLAWEFLASDDCPAALDVNATCTVYIVFMPQALGARTGSIYVGTPPYGVNLQLTGTGAPAPQGILITNVLTGKTLDVTNASDADGTRIQQWDIDGDIQQSWDFQPSGTNFTIVSALSGDALDVTNASSADGAPIQQWSPNGGEQQLWSVVPLAAYSSFSNIVNVLSSKALDVTNASVENGAPIQQWSLDGYQQQVWQLLASGGFVIQTALLSSEVLDATGGSSANGTPIQQWQADGYAQQTWFLVPIGSGYFKIQNLLTGKVLDVTNASLEDGALIQQWDYNGGWQQQWNLEPAGSDSYSLADDAPYFKIVNRLSGRLLDIPEGSLQNGTLIQQKSENGSAEQHWLLLTTK